MNKTVEIKVRRIGFKASVDLRCMKTQKRIRERRQFTDNGQPFLGKNHFKKYCTYVPFAVRVPFVVRFPFAVVLQSSMSISQNSKSMTVFFGMH